VGWWWYKHLARSTATRIQLLPAVLRKSSLHPAWGRPTLRIPWCGLHSRTRLPHRFSVLRLILPAHCHFSVPIGVLCRDFSFLSNHLVSDSIPQRNPDYSSFHSSLTGLELVDHKCGWSTSSMFHHHHQPINIPTAVAQEERAIIHYAGPVRVGGFI
jgi:hypothetical protein